MHHNEKRLISLTISTDNQLGGRPPPVKKSRPYRRGSKLARLESIYFSPHRSEIRGQQTIWTPARFGHIEGLPQIFWADGNPWREANLWTFELASSRCVSLRTVLALATALHAYANWLEEAKIAWWHFPERKSERCIIQFRGHLISARDEGRLSPSTVSQRMRVVIRFYRWLRSNDLISTSQPMWRERTIGIHLQSSTGIDRTISVTTTDVHIPNRSTTKFRLEDGLFPVSSDDRNKILAFAQENSSVELYLFLTLGFFTGMRLGTIADIKIQTLQNAIQDSSAVGLFRLSLGPSAQPPVATKFSVSGDVWITKTHLDWLLDYAYSVRRLQREARATVNNKNLLFLTRFGNPYARRGTDKSVALNVEMHAFRKKALAAGNNSWRNLRFHQTRSTFATELAKIAISTVGAVNAIALVRDALLHKHESTSLRYIKFIETMPAKIEAANVFTQEFLGLIESRRH
ncbi:hypothetical protein LMG26411_03163 [Cupriavidus numazuensis]|uniref:Core-binding (CB) domain-containing protein n=1 Tax=Cupriavidus numazuensis TaxID=221992 RepID=A0ABM8THZ0_9BURK|nr:hypothetical protein LMG26411_03163 [Cupriavidus numazuensis]